MGLVELLVAVELVGLPVAVGLVEPVALLDLHGVEGRRG